MRILLISLFALIGISSLAYISQNYQKSQPSVEGATQAATDQDVGGLEYDQHPLAIEYMRQQDYPGSDIIVEQQLSPGSDYSKAIVSYKSEGLKQYALLTIPNGQPPADGWPAIVFNHGYIPPTEYRTNERYVAYVDGFARNGYVVIKPDYRGHGNSEGRAEGGYGSPAYTIDVLNALASVQRLPEVNPDKIGMWGHSMGGWITQRSMVITDKVKAGVIWGGVVGSYQDLQTEWWNRRDANRPSPSPQLTPGGRGYWRRQMYAQYGSFEENPEFWNSLSVIPYLKDLAGPIQLHHAKGDATVPYQLSERFDQNLQAANQNSKLFLYEGDDHNISTNFSTAMRESVAFFDQHLNN